MSLKQPFLVIEPLRLAKKEYSSCSIKFKGQYDLKTAASPVKPESSDHGTQSDSDSALRGSIEGDRRPSCDLANGRGSCECCCHVRVCLPVVGLQHGSLPLSCGGTTEPDSREVCQ